MLEKSFGLLFFLKRSKNEKNESGYVYLRITVDGIAKELSTKRLWYYDRWSQDAMRATGTKEDCRQLNAYLDSLTASIHKKRQEMMAKGKVITAEELKDFATGKSETRRTILVVFKEHNKKMESLVGQEYAKGTLQRFITWGLFQKWSPVSIQSGHN